MKRRKRFGLLLSGSEKIALSKLAQLEGALSQAALIRRLIHQAAVQHGITITDSPIVDPGSVQVQENNHVVQELDL